MKLSISPEEIAKCDPRFKRFFSDQGVQSVDMPSDGVLYAHPGKPGGPASGLKVLGIAGDAAACGYFRIVYPLMVLAALGAQVEARVVTRETPITAYSFIRSNVIMLQRAIEPYVLHNIQAIASVIGATIVYDLDDYLHGVASTSPAYQVYNKITEQGKTVLETINEFLRSMDGVIFSTRELAAAYASQAPNAHVIMNGLDHNLGHRDWDLSKPDYDWRSLADSRGLKVDSESILFGWSGGSTHYDDLRELGNSVSEILSKTKNSFFGICTNAQLAYEFCVNQWNLPLDRVVFIPPTHFKDYPRTLSAYDVAMCPLQNNLFNQAKSSLRLLEFGAWGVPYVASKVAPFQRFHKESNGEGGSIVTKPSEFAKETIALIEDKDLRKQKGDFLKKYVREEHDICNTSRTLCFTLKSFMSGSKGGAMTRPFLQMQDEHNKIPKLKDKLIFPKSIKCPCGSGKIYASCCTPAFGRV